MIHAPYHGRIPFNRTTHGRTDERDTRPAEEGKRAKDTRHERTNRPTHAPRKNHLPHHTSHQSTARTDTCADAAPADWRSSEDNKQARRHTEREHRQRAPPRSITTHPPRAHPGHHTTRPSGRAAVATLVRMECGQHGQRPLRRPRRSPHRLRIRTGPGQHPRTRVRDANRCKCMTGATQQNRDGIPD